MFKRQLVATAVAASLLYVAPTFTPVPTFLSPEPAQATPCVGSITFGSAFAGCLPAPVSSSHTPTPWAIIGLVAGVATLMFNAAYVWQTECRELTLDEAMTASALPVVGMAINQARGPHRPCAAAAPAH